MIDPRPFIGLHIKDDTFLQLMSDYDLTIQYDIDFDHENIPDAYWINCFAHGVSFNADASQLITCAFVYLREADGYQRFPWTFPDLQISEGEIPSLGAPSKRGQSKDSSWVRYDGTALSVHLTADPAGPRLLCIMHPTVVPGRVP